MEICENLDLNDLDREIWKEIEEYDEDYFVSNLGRVKSFKGINERILEPIENNVGGKFGVKQNTVSNIKNGKTWQHLNLRGD